MLFVTRIELISKTREVNRFCLLGRWSMSLKNLPVPFRIMFFAKDMASRVDAPIASIFNYRKLSGIPATPWYALLTEIITFQPASIAVLRGSKQERQPLPYLSKKTFHDSRRH